MKHIINTAYFELRQKVNTRQNTSLAADLATYLQARQHLGKTLMICDKPINTLAVVRKQWLKLARNLQKERASTLNTEKILRLTSTITHMHHMAFTAKSPEEQSSADVFFLEPQTQYTLPLNTYSVFVTTPLQPHEADELMQQLPHNALVVDYAHTIDGSLLRPKSELKLQAEEAWQQLATLLHECDIDTEKLLSIPPPANILDDALDVLLSVSRRFLHAAEAFQHAVELAQPVRLSVQEQRRFDVLSLLAHRVQSLTPHPPSIFSDDTFFLRDAPIESALAALTKLIAKHQQEGRLRLARALMFTTHSE
jgi:hypothetical protein